MTNKEARADLETLLAYIPIYRRFYQSISMGIKALEQEPVLDRIRTEIAEDIEKYNDIYDDTCHGLRMALDVIDKYKAGK